MEKSKDEIVIPDMGCMRASEPVEIAPKTDLEIMCVALRKMSTGTAPTDLKVQSK